MKTSSSPTSQRSEQSPRPEQSFEQSQIRETVAHEEIARRAHELWEQDGRPEGRNDQHWLEAEQQLRGSAPADDAREQARVIKASAERRANGQSSRS